MSKKISLHFSSNVSFSLLKIIQMGKLTFNNETLVLISSLDFSLLQYLGQNPFLGFHTKRDSNQSPHVQRLARMLKFHL